MRAVPVRQDQILGTRIVKLIHLIAAGKDRHVPFEQVDKDRLSGREHGAQQSVFCCPPVACVRPDPGLRRIMDMQHGSTPS